MVFVRRAGEQRACHLLSMARAPAGIACAGENGSLTWNCAEVFGINEPSLDAEMIAMLVTMLVRFGLDAGAIEVSVNSLGEPEEREAPTWNQPSEPTSQKSRTSRTNRTSRPVRSGPGPLPDGQG